MQLKTTLSKIINSAPDVIQFAKDRKFEEAWIILIFDGKPAMTILKQT